MTRIPDLTSRGISTFDCHSQAVPHLRHHEKKSSLLSNFVCPITGAHTNGIERQWRSLKEEIRRGHHVTLGTFDRYLHCWRYRHQLHVDGMRFDRIYDEMVQCLT